MTTSPIRVLHVDDDSSLSGMVTDFLEREDDRLETATAERADEALDLLSDGDIDCVISDYDMPGLNGVEFLDAVRDAHGDLPFILYTGKGSEEVASEAISAGVTDYMQKERGREQYALLANKVANAVEKRRVQESQQRQLQAIETAREGISILDDEGQYVYVNEAYAGLHGYDPEEMVGEHWELVYPEDELEFAREELTASVAEEGYWHGETTGLRNDGSTFIADHAVSATDTGEMVCTVRDMTKRRDREKELRWKRRAVDAAPVGIVITDASREGGPVIYANDQFGEITGYAPSEVVGRDNFDFLNGEETDPAAQEEIATAVENEEPVTVELKSYRRDGEPFWNRVTIAPVRNEAGEIVNHIAFNQDVTEEKEREQRVREERAFIEGCLDALGDVFYVFDTDGKPIRWNDHLESVTGYTSDEIEEMEATDFFAGEGAERVADSIERIYETGRGRVEANLVTKDGDHIPHEYTGAKLVAEDGSVAGFVGVGRDITERKQRERDLRRQNERLEEFASVVSHDLRNPLNVAQGRLGMAMEDCKCGCDDHFEAVNEAHDRMHTLVDDILTLARNGESVSDTIEPVQLQQLFEECWETVQTEDASLDARNTGTVYADRSRLKQLAENLIRNAVEHGGEDVTVRVGRISDERGFYVEDTGAGIPDGEHEKVFDGGYTTSSDGNGFGLAIVRQIAEAHGWTAELGESADGGARFELRDVQVV